MKGWKELFDEEKEVTDIAGKVTELEKEYKKWDWINTSLIFLGFGIILCSLGGSRMIQNILLGSGIIVAITGDSMKPAELTKAKAQKSGYELLSLIVFADNSPALALYKLLGFEVVQNIKLEGNEFIPHQGGCVLLRCKVAT
jgi:hypothetical protein